jgi:serine/threonine protein kinase
MTVNPGDILLEKYRVERVLGQGGMGVVVAARHVDLGELFAIKFLLPAALQHAQAVERFVREARAAAKLKGEHIAKVYDVGRLPDGRPYMALEYLDGTDLKEIVEKRGAVPIPEAVALVVQACEALSEAHRLGIVHRDLKPANLFVIRRPNGTPCVKVLDFGISKQLTPDDPEQHELTKTGMIVGSPFYMSPEQMTRAKEVDARSDIWSLGCVLYELVTGQRPFQADALTALVGMVLQEEPPPPRAHFAGIPPALEAVILRCLAKPKEQRFQSAEDLITALRTALGAAVTAELPRPALPSHPEVKLVAVPEPHAARQPHAAAHLASQPAHAPHGFAALRAESPEALASSSTSAGWGHTAPEGPPPRRSRAGLIAGSLAALAVAAGSAWLTVRGGSDAPEPASAATPEHSLEIPEDTTEPAEPTIEEPPPETDVATLDLDSTEPAPGPSPPGSAAPKPAPAAPPVAPKAGQKTPPPEAPPTAPTRRSTMY